MSPEMAPRLREMDILLGFDGSEHAQAAVDLLNTLPLSPESHLHLLAVMPPQRITHHERLAQALEMAAERLKTRFPYVQTQIKAGTPAESITNLAEEMSVDLIILGAKGLRATLGILLGGVVQQVVEYSRRPVLVVRTVPAPEQLLFRRALLVTDGSVFSQRAVDYLAGSSCSERPPGFGRAPCGLPLPADTEVHLMHVLPPLASPEISLRTWAVGPEALYPTLLPQAELEAIQKEEERLGQEILEQAVAQLKHSGIDPQRLHPVLRHGDAATEILAYAKQERINLIICGSRGLSQVTGWLLGSVSRKLVHYAECSVLIVK